MKLILRIGLEVLKHLKYLPAQREKDQCCFHLFYHHKTLELSDMFIYIMIYLITNR